MARCEKTGEGSDARRLADLLLEIVHELGPRRYERGAEAEEHADEQTKQERYRQHACVRRKIDNEREIHVVEQTGERVEQEIVAPHAENEADHAAADRERS